jgi:uncharacterized protein (DUF2267 family)
MPMRYPYMVERVARAGGFRSLEEAERAIRATARVLGERLPLIDIGPITSELPPEVAEPLERVPHGEAFGAEELYRRVAELEGISLGLARERAQVVCRELAEILTGEAREHLTLHASADLAALFEPSRAWGDPPPRPRPRARRTRGLAESRPGSRHPISESRPRGQTHSVAERAQPHGESKLSSGASSAEEERDTLATGRRGSKRPLADGER